MENPQNENIPIGQYLVKMEKTIDRFEKKLDENTKLTGGTWTVSAIASTATGQFLQFM